MTKINLKQWVIEEFSGKVAQEKYIQKAEEGFWKSEDVLIKKYFTKKGKVLDIGCGTGRTTIQFKKRGYDVVGVDLTPAMIKNAKKIAKKKKLKINYQIGDATRLKFKTNSFDYSLFSNQGWTQIPGSENRLNALKETHRILNKGGIHIFSIHKRKWLSKRLFFWIYMWLRFYVFKKIGFPIYEQNFGDRFFTRSAQSGTEYKTKQYIHIPSISEVKKQLEQAGFTLLYVESAQSITKDTSFNVNPVFFVCKK